MSAEHRIVVGVDGSPSAENAARWAAELAARSGRSLHLVHVVPEVAVGDAALDAAARTATRDHPDLAVRALQLAGDPAVGLVESAAAADLLVVGRARHGRLPLHLGSVAHRVLSHASCPTAVVPCGPRVSANAVVVAVSDSAGGAEAVRFAFAEAARRAAELVAVRSWSSVQRRLESTAALTITANGMWEAAERTLLDDCLRPHRLAYPAVRVRQVVTGEPIEIVLEREGANAVMVVVGCRRADDSRLPRLGPVASWAAHHFDVPVVVVGHPAKVYADE